MRKRKKWKMMNFQMNISNLIRNLADALNRTINPKTSSFSKLSRHQCRSELSKYSSLNYMINKKTREYLTKNSQKNFTIHSRNDLINNSSDISLGRQSYKKFQINTLQENSFKKTPSVLSLKCNTMKHQNSNEKDQFKSYLKVIVKRYGNTTKNKFISKDLRKMKSRSKNGNEENRSERNEV